MALLFLLGITFLSLIAALGRLFGEIRLDSLQYLELGNNQLTEFPSFGDQFLFYRSFSFTQLGVSGCWLKFLGGQYPRIYYVPYFSQSLGQLLACLKNLTSLREFRLEENHVEGTFPSSLLHTLRSLIAISVFDDYFNGSFSLSLFANHSNLKIIFISCSNANLKLETENPPFIPSFQLKLSSIHNCTLNEARNNKVPSFLLHQYSLQDLELSYLNVSGTLPSWLLTNNTKLNNLNLTHNMFTGPFELNSTSKFLQMEYFDISLNPIKDEMSSHIGFIFPNLISLDMSSTSLQGCFPASIGEMRLLYDLDLSNNNLSGYLPQEFGMGSNDLSFLKLSNNNLSGPCLPTGSNFLYLFFLGLDNNNFNGKLPGRIPKLISSFVSLRVLMLKENKLEGSIPVYLFELKNISLLDLSKNKISGGIPYCLYYITFGKMDAPRETKIGSFIVSWTTRFSPYSFNTFTGEVGIREGKQNVTLSKDQEVDFTTKRRYISIPLPKKGGLRLGSERGQRFKPWPCHIVVVTCRIRWLEEAHMWQVTCVGDGDMAHEVA
ncbi:receptor-like protein 8 [Prosopis cineraria]|uniref:receptor-like protein 8 n=1 Tax=Prosopis cineraria TaxID=364024 RepID=UPI0024100EA2|nr:receptor-like protein 8 [Prosopis cineraria]